MALLSRSDLLEKIEAIAPDLEARADETERGRAIPADLIERLRAAGLFRMMAPKALGGEELSLLQAVRVIERLARADGSAGWNAMVIFGFNIALGRFPKPVVNEVLSKSGDVLIRGGLAPLGRATPVKGGYMISGRWPFASGSYEPDWVVGSCLIIEDGKPRMAGPMPDMCMALVPAKHAEFLDTWHTVGLCGSSSNDFEIHDQFVADDHTTNLFDPTRPPAYDTPLLRLPFPALTGPTHSAVVLGIAQAALDELVALSRTKRSAFNPMMTLGEDTVFRHQLGLLSARLFTLHAGMDKQVERTMAAAEAGTPPSMEDLAAGGALVSYTHVECVDIVNEAFALAGSVPVYSKSTLQRRWRDVRCAAQHVGASPASYQRHAVGLIEGAAPPWR